MSVVRDNLSTLGIYNNQHIHYIDALALQDITIMAANVEFIIESNNHTEDEQEAGKQDEDPPKNEKNASRSQNGKKPEVVVVIAGSSRSGKSTALNNIFHTDFDNIYSNYSVTREVDLRRFTK